jgi:restriction system protein
VKELRRVEVEKANTLKQAAIVNRRESKQATIENDRAMKANAKEAKAAIIESKFAKVEAMNEKISVQFCELENLLQATIDVDDYVDLDSLRKAEDSTPFDRPELEIPLKRPEDLMLPAEPAYQEPPKPKGFFGRKKKLEAATARAKELFASEMSNWSRDVAAIQEKSDRILAAHVSAEKRRVDDLANEKARFKRELDEHNQNIDQFISNLAYGDPVALQEYIAIVVENSIYPDDFDISREFTYEPASAELVMRVSIPSPSTFPAVKSFKYVKSSDQIKETPLSKKEQKDRYCSVIYQVAIRSFHEVFEADRRGLIKTISLEVGTNDTDPATGLKGFIPFVGVSAKKESFMEFDLTNLVPIATLKHLGAAISKDPIGLLAANVSGIRKS